MRPATVFALSGAGLALLFAILLFVMWDRGDYISPETLALDVPRVALVGDLPNQGSRLIFRIDRDGVAHAGDRRRTVGQVRARFESEPCHFDSSDDSQVDFVIAAERTTSWKHIRPILELAAESIVCQPRIVFLVRGDDKARDALPGALATYLPVDRWADLDHLAAHVRHITFALDSQGSDPWDIHDVLRETEPTETLVVLDAPDELPLETVLQVVAVAKRAGVAGLGFGAPRQAGHDASVEPDARGWRIFVDGRPCPRDRTARRATEHVRGLAGFARVESLCVGPELETDAPQEIDGAPRSDR